MKYRIYIFNKRDAWELYKIVYSEEKTKEIISNLTCNQCSRYIVINELPDMDITYDIGSINNPIKYIKKK